MSKNILPGGVTQEMIDQWKLKFGDGLKAIEVPMDDEGKKVATGYFRKPNLDIISAASKFADKDPIKSGMVLFDNCWLGGDEIMKTDDECKMSVIEALNSMFKIRQATIKNL